MSIESSAVNLINAISDISSARAKDSRSDLLSGIVTSASPLQITVMMEESKELTFPENLLFVPFTCKAKTITIDGETVQLWGNLKVGERVFLTSYNAGTKYLVERAD